MSFFLKILLVRPTRNSPVAFELHWNLRSICGRNSESTWKQGKPRRLRVEVWWRDATGYAHFICPGSNTKIDIYDIYVLSSRLGFWKVEPFGHQWFWVFVTWHDWNLTTAAGSQLKPRPGCLLGLSPVPGCDCTKVGGFYWMFFFESKTCVQCSCLYIVSSYFGDRNESKARCKRLIQYYLFDWAIWLWEQFWSCMYAWTHLFIQKHVTLICVRVAPWPEGNLERHFWHKLQVASCQLSPWLAFLELILKLTGPHSSRWGMARAIWVWASHSRFGTRFSTRRTVQLNIFI